jgi:glycosyltransferase involved in cell wall biosynthesis
VVISAGHGNLHFLSPASAAYRAGFLESYITSIYLKPWLRSLLKAAPRRLLGETRLSRLLVHHRLELDAADIRVIASAELVGRALKAAERMVGHRVPGGYARAAFVWPMVLYGWRSQGVLDRLDIFHVRSGYGRFAIEKARKAGATILVDHSIADSDHLFQVYEQEANRWSPARKRRTLPQGSFGIVNADLEAADLVVVNSDFVKQTLIASGRVNRERIAVLYFGVDTQRFSPSPTQRNPAHTPFTILFVGGIDFRKGVLYLLEAFRQLGLPDARLVLIGPIADIPIERYRGLYEHVPSVPLPQLVDWYRRASVFVFPSLAEGSARVNFLAMACGVPVITTPESGSVVRDGIDGFVIPARDVDALANRIRLLYRQRERVVAMGFEGRQRVLTDFTWSHYETRILKLYEEVHRGEWMASHEL